MPTDAQDGAICLSAAECRVCGIKCGRKRAAHHSILVGAFFVDAVGPALVEIDEKDEIVAEDRQAVQSRHLDDKCEQVVDDGVEEFVNHRTPREVCYTLELVVDEELRRHHNKAKRVDASHCRSQNPGVPA